MDYGYAACGPWFHYSLKKKNHSNDQPHVAEGNDFLCRAVVTINKLAYVKCDTVCWGNSKQSLAGFYVFLSPKQFFSNP